MWISGADTAGACSKLVKTAETEKGGADRGLYALFYFNGRYGCHTPDTAFPGVVSGLLKSMHLIPPSINLLGTPSAFVPVYVLSGIWQSAGWNSIIFIAALSSVDGQLYDAAKVDGANRWQQVIHVELPALVPTIVILLIMNMGRVLSVGFEKVFLMQNDMNLPVSEVISTYVFNVGVQSGQFSFGSAVGLFNTVINFAFLMIANMVSKKAADISLM